MESEQISQFEDQLVIPDAVFDYTEDLRIQAVPIVIDNGEMDSSSHLHISSKYYNGSVFFTFRKGAVICSVLDLEISGSIAKKRHKLGSAVAMPTI